MRRSLPLTAALLSAAWLSTAGALGLGEIEVQSRLNQRFVASIPVTAAAAEELESLRVSLASNAEFARAGLERPAFLSTLRFAVKTDGVPRIEISSDQMAREPFLTLLLEVRDGGSRLVREYTVFLDPPDYIAPSPGAATFYETAPEAASSRPPAAEPKPAPTAAAVRPSAPSADAPALAAPRPAPPPPPVAAATGDRYGPIAAKETLWSVATRLRPAGATMDQVLLALYTRNPAAFEGGINGLRKGAVLQVPSAAEILAQNPEAARAEVMRLREAAAPVPPTVAAPSVTAPAPSRAPIVLPPTEPLPTPTPTPAPPVAPTEAMGAPAAEVDPAALGPAAETPAAAIADPAETLEATALDAATETVPELPAPAASLPAAAAPVIAPDAAQQPAAAEPPGLLETLLLPLAGGLAVLLGAGFLVSRMLGRRKAAAARMQAPAGGARAGAVVPKPAAVAAATAAAGPKRSVQDELEALQASLDSGHDGTVDELPTEQLATQQFETQQLETQQLETQQIQTQQLRSAGSGAKPALVEPTLTRAPAAGGDTTGVDFDLTGEFESQTVQINLDANDPVSEADFHLAYGLYDEAALLLTQAAEKEPHRGDIRVKLAETYFAAGKADEFLACAEAAKPLLAPGDWQKVAIMGQQLCPDAALFGGASAGAASAAADAAAADVDLDLNMDAPLAPDTAVAGGAEADAKLDFKLEDLDLPKLDEPQLELAASDKGEALEFDLSEFDLATPEPAAEKPAAAGGAAGENAVDFDLDLTAFDLAAAEPAGSQPAASAPGASPAAEMSTADSDIRLEDIDLGEMAADSGQAAGDEAATKLDLARAYVEMGDHEMARALLDEVMEQGNARQQQDAKVLIDRLG